MIKEVHKLKINQMGEKRESFIDDLGSNPENENIKESKPEEVKLEDDDQVAVEKETTRSLSEKDVLEKAGTSPENQKKFEFDKEANSKFAGAFENKKEELTLNVAKKIVMENPGDFDLPEGMAKRMTNEQIKRIIIESSDLREKITANSEFAEIVHLHETFKKAGGSLDTSEKILFFRTASKVISDPELLKEIRIKLWESMEGANMDERAAEKLEEKEKYVEDKIESYKRDEIEKIIVGEEDREEIEKTVDGEIEEEVRKEISRRTAEGKKELSKKEQEEIRAEKEEKRSVLEAEAIKKIISNKKDRIGEVLDRSVTDEEIIFLKNEKGKDLNEISLSGRFFSKKIRLGDTEMGKTKFNQFLSGESAGMEDYFNDKTKDFEGEWDEKFEKAKDEIIEGSLDEIPDELVQKIYRKKKSLRIGRMFSEKEVGDKEKIEGFKEDFSPDGKHINESLGILGSKENPTLEDFYRVIGGFTNEGFKKYAEGQKMEHSKEKYSLLLLFLKFMFDFTANKNEKK